MLAYDGMKVGLTPFNCSAAEGSSCSVNFTKLRYREPGDYYGADSISLVIEGPLGWSANVSTWHSSPANMSRRTLPNSSITETLNADWYFEDASLAYATSQIALNDSSTYYPFLVVNHAAPYPDGVELDMVAGNVIGSSSSIDVNGNLINSSSTVDADSHISVMKVPAISGPGECSYYASRSESSIILSALIACFVGMCLLAYGCFRVFLSVPKSRRGSHPGGDEFDGLNEMESDGDSHKIKRKADKSTKRIRPSSPGQLV